MAAKRLADGNIRLDAATTKPAVPAAAKVSELSATSVVDLSCGINKADYKLGATGNNAVTEQELCKKGEGNAPGPATYEGSVTPFLYYGPDGAYSAADNTAYEALKEEGTTLYLFEREGKPVGEPWAVGDTYEYYEVITGTPQPASDRLSGYVKRTVPLFVQDHQSGVVAAS